MNVLSAFVILPSPSVSTLCNSPVAGSTPLVSYPKKYHAGKPSVNRVIPSSFCGAPAPLIDVPSGKNKISVTSFFIVDKFALIWYLNSLSLFAYPTSNSRPVFSIVPALNSLEVNPAEPGVIKLPSDTIKSSVVFLK